MSILYFALRTFPVGIYDLIMISYSVSTPKTIGVGVVSLTLNLMKGGELNGIYFSYDFFNFCW